MDIVQDAIGAVASFLPLLATIVVVIAVLAAVNLLLKRRWHGDPDARYRFQLIMLVLSFVGALIADGAGARHTGLRAGPH